MTKTNGFNKFINTLLNSLFGVILFVVSVLVFHMPYEIAIIPRVAGLLPILQNACGAILIICFLLLYISKPHYFKDIWFLILAAAFLAVLIYSTSINQVDMQGAMSDSGLFALFNILILAIFIKVNPKRYLFIFYIIYLVVSIANTYTVFSTAGVGMWHDWQTYLDPTYSLVGNFNLGIMFAMPMLIAGTVWSSKYGRWLKPINYLVGMSLIAMAIKCSSDTQLIVYGLTILIMILNDLMHAAKGLYKILRIFNAAVLFAIDFIIFFVTVVLNRMDFFAKIGYDGDFHGRRNIWNIAKSWIVEKPVFGNGVETLDYTASKWMPYTDAGHAHCFFLEVPYQTGLVGSVIFLAMVVVAIIAILRAKNIHIKWLTGSLMAVTFMAGIVESYPMVFMIIVIALCYYIAVKDRDEAAEDAVFDEKVRARFKATQERKKTRYKQDV